MNGVTWLYTAVASCVQCTGTATGRGVQIFYAPKDDMKLGPYCARVRVSATRQMGAARSC